MAISFNRALGIHEQALNLRSQRAELLANNLANADTPNFKARDVDFAAVLEKASGGRASGTELARTDTRHFSSRGDAASGAPQYRIPNQPSIDGNTVEEHEEMARYAKNTVDFEASMYFLSSKFRGLQNAIRGEV